MPVYYHKWNGNIGKDTIKKLSRPIKGASSRRRWLTIDGEQHSFPEDMYVDVMECDKIKLAEHLTSPDKTIRTLANIRAQRIKNGDD